MAYSTINKSTDYFNTKLYTGNASTQNITGVGFQPDWTWIKDRNYDNGHNIYDAVRGTTKRIQSQSTNAEATRSNGLTAFISDGFSIGNDSQINDTSSYNYVSWNWKANGQGSSNTDGSINTTYTSVSTTAGFSISKYTGTGSAATIGHGLGVAPKMVIVKRLNNADGWQVYADGYGVNNYLRLDTTASESSDSSRFGAAPTASVFSVGTANGTNASGDTYIAYCFAEKTGYSKIGSYTGNGNTDGIFVYTGFKPAWILRKCTTSGTGESWVLIDNKRPGYNVTQLGLFPNGSNQEDTAAHNAVDMLSNGFKMRSTDTRTNASNKNYFYMAFGQTLVGSNNIPATAR